VWGRRNVISKTQGPHLKEIPVLLTFSCPPIGKFGCLVWWLCFAEMTRVRAQSNECHRWGMVAALYPSEVLSDDDVAVRVSQYGISFTQYYFEITVSDFYNI